MTTGALTLALALSAGMLWLIWRTLRRRLPGAALVWTAELRLVMAGAVLLFSAGIWWGWPGGLWAPDEMWPEAVIQGLARGFSGGWFDLYPPLHFYVLSIVAGPVLAADAFGVSGLSPQQLLDLLWLVSRSVSLAMAVGLLALLARFAQQCAGAEYGWPVALIVSTTLPLVFYAKTANMDVPYLFWFAASLLWYRAALAPSTEPALAKPLVGFAITAALSVTTKDQAYGLYVLPIAYLAFHTVRRPAGVRALALAFVAGVSVFAVVHNLWSNFEGFQKHLALIVGDGSESFRIVPATLAGELALFKLSAWQLFWCLGVPGVILVCLGLWSQRTQYAWPAWLWLFPLSYAISFMALIGYVYDRFLLGPALILALFSASGLRWLISRGTPGRAGAAVLGAWLVWRAMSIDVLLIRDSRYAAEAWLREHASSASIASAWQAGYLPRFRGMNHQEIRPNREATVRANPEFIVINVEFANRYPADAPLPKWLAWLEAPGGPYEEVFRYKDALKYTELPWWPVFVDRRETLFTNLDKANPEIVIFRRR